MGFNPPWNLAGCPVVVIPVRGDSASMPAGVQVVGSPGTERRLLALAAEIEATARAQR